MPLITSLTTTNCSAATPGFYRRIMLWTAGNMMNYIHQIQQVETLLVNNEFIRLKLLRVFVCGRWKWSFPLFTLYCRTSSPFNLGAFALVLGKGKALRINHNIVKRSILELHTFDRSAVQRKKNNNIGLVSQNHRISSEKNQRANSDAILLLEALHHHRHGSFATYYSLSQSCRLIRLPFVPHPSSHTSPKFRPTSFELSTLESIATPTKFQPLSKLKSPITLAYPPTVSFGTNHTRWECDNISLDGLPSSSRSIFVSLS
jgi:hypothetical protein